MQIFLLIFSLFFIIFCGWLFRRLGIATDRWVHYLNLYAYYAALPALVFISFWGINWQESRVYSLVGFNFLLLAAFYGLAWLFLGMLKISSAYKASIFLVLAVGNTIYLGFPILSALFSQVEIKSAGIALATLHLVMGLAVATAVAKLSNQTVEKSYKPFWDLLKNPFVPAMVLGMLAGFFNWQGHLAQSLRDPLSSLGQTASPVALFALGAFLQGKFLRHHLLAASLVSTIKLVAFPAAGFLVVKFFGYSSTEASLTALVFAMPAAASTFVIAEKFNLDKAFVANTILITTLGSFFTLMLASLIF